MNTFRYTDAQGNLVGPLSREALAVLKKTGVINDGTQVLDEATKQMSTLSEILPKAKDVTIPSLQNSSKSFSSSHSPQTNKQSPKIGKRGWCGVVLFFIGLLVLLGADRNAKELDDQWFQHNMGILNFSSSGIETESEKIIRESNIEAGLFWMAVGAGFAVWGYKKYGKNPPPIK